MTSITATPSLAAESYEAGQLWHYHTRPGEEASRVLINLIEPHDKLGKMIHISVLDVNVKNPHTASGMTHELPHFPVSEETLQKSLTTLAGRRDILADYREGYEVWKEAFDAGKAGIFTISVAEIVDVVERAANQ